MLWWHLSHRSMNHKIKKNIKFVIELKTSNFSEFFFRLSQYVVTYGTLKFGLIIVKIEHDEELKLRKKITWCFPIWLTFTTYYISATFGLIFNLKIEIAMKFPNVLIYLVVSINFGLFEIVCIILEKKWIDSLINSQWFCFVLENL